MEFLKTDLIGLIQYLMPGFVAAWIFYGLTAHQKLSPFERVVEALIFTAIVQTVTFFVRIALLTAGSNYSIGEWSAEVSLAWSMLIAVSVGISFSTLSNSDIVHGMLREIGATRRTSFPSEWYSAFHRSKPPYLVVLHLVQKSDEPQRWLYGQVDEWPDDPHSGHFVLANAEWLDTDNRRTPLENVERVLVPANVVTLVEFIKSTSADLPQADAAESALGNAHT